MMSFFDVYHMLRYTRNSLCFSFQWSIIDGIIAGRAWDDARVIDFFMDSLIEHNVERNNELCIQVDIIKLRSYCLLELWVFPERL